MPTSTPAAPVLCQPYLRSRRGAISTSLAFILGAGLSLGVAVDMAAVLLQSAHVPDLIGSLGLPGAVLALVGAFFLGAKAYMTLKNPSAPTTDIRSDFAIRDLIVQEVTRSRDDAREAVADAVTAQTINHQQTLMRLEAIERAILSRR